MNKPKIKRDKIKNNRIGVAISDIEKERADRVAYELDITTSALVRKAVNKFVDDYERNEENG